MNKILIITLAGILGMASCRSSHNQDLKQQTINAEQDKMDLSDLPSQNLLTEVIRW